MEEKIYIYIFNIQKYDIFLDSCSIPFDILIRIKNILWGIHYS